MALMPVVRIVSRALRSASITRWRRPSSRKEGQAFSKSASLPPSAVHARRADSCSVLSRFASSSFLACSSTFRRYSSWSSSVYCLPMWAAPFVCGLWHRSSVELSLHGAHPHHRARLPEAAGETGVEVAVPILPKPRGHRDGENQVVVLGLTPMLV